MPQPICISSCQCGAVRSADRDCHRQRSEPRQIWPVDIRTRLVKLEWAYRARCPFDHRCSVAFQGDMQMLNSKIAAISCARPFKTVRPTIQRRHLVSSRQCQRANSHANGRARQSPKHALFTGRPLYERSKRHTLLRTQATTDPLVPLGLDFLTFLAATVLVIPLFKSVKASPVLGFLFSGLLLGQLG